MQSFFLCLSILLIIIIISFMARNRGAKKMTQEVPVDKACDLLKDSNLTLLDVRTPKEFEQGHIEGAKLIQVAELNDRIGELAIVKDKEILVYCHAGNRSKTACGILEKNGFTQIKNLQGGIVAWMKNGNKVVKD